jgi:hypothetical protein
VPQADEGSPPSPSRYTSVLIFQTDKEET